MLFFMFIVKMAILFEEASRETILCLFTIFVFVDIKVENYNSLNNYLHPSALH